MNVLLEHEKLKAKGKMTDTKIALKFPATKGDKDSAKVTKIKSSRNSTCGEREADSASCIYCCQQAQSNAQEHGESALEQELLSKKKDRDCRGYMNVGVVSEQLQHKPERRTEDWKIGRQLKLSKQLAKRQQKESTRLSVVLNTMN